MHNERETDFSENIWRIKRRSQENLLQLFRFQLIFIQYFARLSRNQGLFGKQDWPIKSGKPHDPPQLSNHNIKGACTRHLTQPEPKICLRRATCRP